MTTITRSASPRDWAALALLGVTLGAGLLLGVALDRTLLRPAPRSVTVVDTLAARRPPGLERLDLSAVQRAQIDSIMARQRPRMDSVLGVLRPQVRQITDSIRDEVAQVLTAAQRQELLRLAEEGEHEGSWFRDHDRKHGEEGERRGDDHEGSRDRDAPESDRPEPPSPPVPPQR
jgi:hypothetical protein